MAYLKVGQVILLDTGCFRWIIDDFLSFAWPQDATLKSPYFGFPDASYRIYLSFFGPDGPLRLNLRKDNFSPLPKLRVRLGMRTGYRGKLETRRGQTDSDGNFVVHVWMPSAEFWERRAEILTDGRLTVICDFVRLDVEENASVVQDKLPIVGEEKVDVEKETSERDSDEEETNTERKTVKKLQKDLKNLLISGEDSDVTIKVRGKEFPAHRIFLRARSPVFKSMFSHEMVEKQSGVVVIDDCDPGTFPDFLNYVYTGSTKHICVGNVCSLYTAADKYGVQELKEECAVFMKGNMSVGTFCDMATLAVRHDEGELVDLATGFFCSNAKEIIRTAKWQTFLHENTTAGNALFIKVLSKVR